MTSQDEAGVCQLLEVGGVDGGIAEADISITPVIHQHKHNVGLGSSAVHSSYFSTC